MLKITTFGHGPVRVVSDPAGTRGRGSCTHVTFILGAFIKLFLTCLARVSPQGEGSGGDLVPSIFW